DRRGDEGHGRHGDRLDPARGPQVAGPRAPAVGVKLGVTPSSRGTRRGSTPSKKSRVYGGGGGIRTHGSLAASAVFKTAAFDRSATPPIGETAINIRPCWRLRVLQSRLDANPDASTGAAPCTPVHSGLKGRDIGLANQ